MTPEAWARVVRRLPTARIQQIEAEILAMTPDEHAARYPGVDRNLRLQAIRIVKQERLSA